MVRLIKKESKRQVNEMSVLASPSSKEVFYKRDDLYPDTIIKTLTCVKNIWRLIATHMVDNSSYVSNRVSLAYDQINHLMSKYHSNNNAYSGEPLVDLSDATRRLKRDRPGYYEVEIVSPSETHFKYTINCSQLGDALKQLLVNAFTTTPQISRTENHLTCETSVEISGDEIKITITFAVI